MKPRLTKRTITIIEPRGWPEFSKDDWQSVQAWMKDRRIPNLRAFFHYVGVREAVFDAMLTELERNLLRQKLAKEEQT